VWQVRLYKDPAAAVAAQALSAQAGGPEEAGPGEEEEEGDNPEEAAALAVPLEELFDELLQIAGGSEAAAAEVGHTDMREPAVKLDENDMDL
jgi:hypothetical protein